ncbi:MAG: hypothetical protein QOD06_1509 [Candidatus Binatota bacterium]|nr:hypothetical protein [Candidatus Binatota bacterium]
MQASFAQRLRCGFVSPLPPVRSGVATAAAHLLPPLGERMDVELFLDQERVEGPSLDRFPRRHLLDVPARAAELDLLLYQMGNSSVHAGVYEQLIHFPGVVELHDAVLHHFYLEYYFACGRPREYARKLRRMHGAKGRALARAVSADFGGSLGYLDLPMRGEVLEHSVGVVVHSEWARRAVRADRIDLPILRIGLPCAVPAVEPSRGVAFRRRHGIPADAFVIGALGFATPLKRVDRMLEALSALRGELDRVHLLVVGEVNPVVRLAERAQTLGLEDRVTLTGWASEEDYWSALAASDAVLSLRFPTAGESSLPLLQAMALGKPVLVSALRQFLELPDRACRKIPLGRAEVPALVEALRELVLDPSAGAEIGAAARAHAAVEASPERAAHAVSTFARVLAPLARRRMKHAVARLATARWRAARVVAARAFRGAERSVSVEQRLSLSGAGWVSGDPPISE